MSVMDFQKDRFCSLIILFVSAGLINLSIFISLYFLVIKEGEALPIGLMVAAWGVADGIWNTQVNSECTLDIGDP